MIGRWRLGDDDLRMNEPAGTEGRKVEDLRLRQIVHGCTRKEPFVPVNQDDDLLRLQHSGKVPERPRSSSQYGLKTISLSTGRSSTSAVNRVPIPIGASASQQGRPTSVPKRHTLRWPVRRQKAIVSGRASSPIDGRGPAAQVDAALDIMPGRGDELPFPLSSAASHHACELEVSGQAGSGHIGGADDKASAAAAQLEQNLGMEDAFGHRAGNRVVATGILRQEGCTIELIGKHTRIGQEDIVIAAGTAETGKRDVL